ncbi:uncharacterized protein IL334_000320 [Kwoniella shivajii]|uniref:Uncharacterized protein n=1 Tax=Kwoniella shivajii TaxID=564305 RepID=A0ABZ1CNU1_9TREE|nr:hypothetical protein IL334_000320 [Kwoniella shivajii]
MSSTVFSTTSNRASMEDDERNKGSYKHLHLGSGMQDSMDAVNRMSPSNSVLTISFSPPALLGIMSILLLFAAYSLFSKPMVSIKNGISNEQFQGLLERIDQLSKEVKELKRP